MNKKAPLTLVILDGWGYSPQSQGNAIYQAHPKTFNYLKNTFPSTVLQASGRAVGLPQGYQGNSEVGHLTIGAGRIIIQPLTLINDSIDDLSFFSRPTVTAFLTQAAKQKRRLHLVGLLSDGGVHSHEHHLHALIKAAAQYGVKQLFVHALTDGRDTAPQSAAGFFERVCTIMQEQKVGKLATITGRFYGMDRDENWDRTKAFFNVLTQQLDPCYYSWREVLKAAYEKNLSDEYIPPTLLIKEGTIGAEDAIIFFNFRPDRMRQICALFLAIQLPVKKQACTDQPVSPVHSTHIISMTRYHPAFTNKVIFDIREVNNTLMDVLEEHNKNILTAAESEKYAHVTYFFGGGKEKIRPHEKRILVPSPQAVSYAQTPRMSAELITSMVLEALEIKEYDFCLINYANADMVGHTGNFNATVEAIHCLDEQLSRLYNSLVLDKNGILIITSDHGNAEEMIDPVTHMPKTSHTTNMVPFIVAFQPSRRNVWDLLNSTVSLSRLNGLADIAPFILSLIKIQPPTCMIRKQKQKPTPR